jgi:hypothetical protein
MKAGDGRKYCILLVGQGRKASQCLCINFNTELISLGWTVQDCATINLAARAERQGRVHKEIIMSHIFISYARKAIDFAQRIIDALAANDLDTWIDWKSIPKEEDR